MLAPFAEVREGCLDFPHTCRPVQKRPANNREVLWKEMMVAGERLIDALKLETQLNQLIVKNPEDDALIERLNACRGSIAGLGQAYVDAITRHRMAV
jgi:hypothetical protein